MPSGHLLTGNAMAGKPFQFVLLQEEAGDGVTVAMET